MTHEPNDRVSDEIKRDLLPIAVRAFVRPSDASKRTRKARKQPPSEYTLVFDTETKTDPGQALRLGAYQFYRSDDLLEAGFFFDPEVLEKVEVILLRQYAASRGLTLVTKSEIVEQVFYDKAYELRATIVGL